MSQQPPRLARALLKLFCDAVYHEEVEGDLDELFEHNLQTVGLRKARSRYWGDVFKHFNWFFLSRKHYYRFTQKPLDMWSNYLKIAFRNILKHRSYSALNVLGLGVGITCAMLILLYSLHELSFDNFHEKADRTYVVHAKITAEEDPISSAPNALVPQMVREFPEVESGVRIFNRGSYNPFTVKYKDQVFKEDRLFHVDSTFFDIFSFEMLRGNQETSLKEPRSIVLTEAMARKYFGDTDPIGEVLRIDNRHDYTVTGLLKDIPSNSHLHFDFLVSYSSFTNAFFREERWDNASYTSYLLLNQVEQTSFVESKIPGLISRNAKEDSQLTFSLHPMKDIHLRGLGAGFGLEDQNEMRYLYIFGVIGLLILVVASVNYTNLSTARAVYRAREIGMRKVMGAYRRNLFSQFMGESLMVVFIAVVLAFGFAILSLPYFNGLADRGFVIGDLFSTQLLLYVFLVALVVGLMAGIYPALVLSGFRPILVLKGSFKSSRSGAFIRKFLVTGQFVISMGLIIGTMVIFSQLSFMQRKELGYNNDNMVVLPASRAIVNNYPAFKAELLKDAGVLDVTLASESPTQINAGYSLTLKDVDVEKEIFLAGMRADRDFIDALQMELVAGTFFTVSDLENIADDIPFKDRQFAFVLNEEAISQFGVSAEEVIGKRGYMNGRNGIIRGVVKNFHFASMREKILPMAFLPEQDFNNMLVRISGQQIDNTLSKIQERWRRLAPDVPFDYQFMEVEYENLYSAEARLSKLFGVFAMLAIFIACFGLFGLVAFTTTQRAREIGVRKVLGASVTNLVLLLNRDFARLVLIAFLLAGPVTYFLMSGWLREFEYRTSIGAMPLLLSLVVTAFIAFASVSLQSFGAATANPVDVLKEE